MSDVRAVFYLDFDNVFSGLFKLDPDAAIRFASDPAPWLRRLATTLTIDGSRRWLVVRCYLNPAGWVSHADAAGESARLYFSRFRPALVRAGFEVIDCPRYNATKNAADIRIVLDAVDALVANTRYDEFVIASGDSDLAPLIQRLRREDRRTMIISPTDAAEAFTALADRVLDGPQLLALVQGEAVELDESDVLDHDGSPPHPISVPTAPHRDAAYEDFRTAVTAAYELAPDPLNMATLAQQIRDHLGPAIEASRWFGFGNFANAVRSLRLQDLQMSQHQLWDSSRHPVPESTVLSQRRPVLPQPLERLTAQLGLPRLADAWWPAIYQALSDYAHAHHFNLTECTSWSRDRLVEQGLPISRGAVGFVVRGTSFGGCPLHRQPPPDAAEISAAFISYLLHRAEASQLALTDDEIATVRTWLGDAVPRP